MVGTKHRYLLDQVSEELPTIAVGTVALVLSSLSNQMFPRLMGRIVDDDRRGGSSWNIALVVLGGGLASFLRTYTLQVAEERVAYRLSQEAFASILQRKSLDWFQQTNNNNGSAEGELKDDGDNNKDDTNSTSEIITAPAAISNILSEDVQKISKTLTITLANLIRSASSVLFSTTNMLLLNPSLFAVAVSIVPLVGAGAMVLRKRIQQLDQAQGDRRSHLVSFVQERLVHVSMVRQCGRSADEVEHYSQYRGEMKELSESNSLQEGCWMGFLFSASSGALLLVVWMGGKAMSGGRMTGGELTSFSTYAFLLGLGTSGILKAMGEATSGMVAADRYFDLISNDSNDIVDHVEASTEDEMVVPGDVQSIELNDVSFSYRNSETPVVRNLSLKLPRGQVVALVGKNGAGKSTIASILSGLYRPTAGTITIRGSGWSADLSKLTQSKRQRVVQMIPQTSALFDLSILENVRYGKPNASVPDVRYSLTKANCNDFVSALPGGLEFVVGQNGEQLSGGERQRLALARALLADPAVLIMDEPMTSLDNHGASAVADAVSSGRTMLLITHNPKTLELADTVMVLDNGVVAETGTFSELRSNPESKLCTLMPSIWMGGSQ